MTRLANLYRIVRENAAPFYLIDLPGYGYARGGAKSSLEFEAITASLFGERPDRVEGRDRPARPAHPALAALLIVDARHPGLENDRSAWEWMAASIANRGIVATKIDKLARGQRIRALGELESVFQHPIAAVSAATGEGLNELWKLIAQLTKAA
jgi:GTP-binding protein